MSPHNETLGPAALLREAARILATYGWDPRVGPQPNDPRKRGLAYINGTDLAGAIFRARNTSRAAWMTMLRAFDEVSDALGVDRQDSGAFKRVGLSMSAGRAERTLLRAAERFERRAAA